MTTKKVGRPRKEIDWELVKRLSMIQCTTREIAAIIGVDHSTLVKRSEFSPIHEKGKEEGKASLRRKQYALADKNAAMCIWLGKQWLGQRDEPISDEQKETRYTVVWKDE